jgi:hypothetical protein
MFFLRRRRDKLARPNAMKSCPSSASPRRARCLSAAFGIFLLSLLVEPSFAQPAPDWDWWRGGRNNRNNQPRRIGGGTIPEPTPAKPIQPVKPATQPLPQHNPTPPMVGQPVLLIGESAEMTRQAEAQFKAGNFDEADRLLRLAIAKDPGNQAAYNLLRQVQEQRDETIGKVIRDKLRSIVLEEVNFTATPLDAILEYLSDESQRLSADRSAINFVLKAPDDYKSARITLKMKKTPMFDVLKYVCDLGGASFLIDDAKVTVIPRIVPAAP